MISASVHQLGIFTARSQEEPPFFSQRFYRQLIKLGRKAGIEVFVFTPDDICHEHKQVIGYTYDSFSRQWCRHSFEMPFLVYDRCFPGHRDDAISYTKQKRLLREEWGAAWMNAGLTGKWEVFRRLLEDPELTAYLPQTEPLTHVTILMKWLEQKGTAFLKPDNGSQGRGTLLVEQDHEKQDGYLIKGRKADNRPIHVFFKDAKSLLHWVKSFIGDKPYLIQETLRLRLSNNLPCDIRALIQKNGKGSWSLTGIAVRCGSAGSATANLHGGGTAIMAKPFLIETFGEKHAQSLLERIEHLTYRIADKLEQSSGRLTELGLDFGVDLEGRLWFLEGNSKPGRCAFAQNGYKDIEFTSIAAPIRYAKWLLKHRHRGPYMPQLSSKKAAAHTASTAANDDLRLQRRASPFPYE
jgi:hypothetical protein